MKKKCLAILLGFCVVLGGAAAISAQSVDKVIDQAAAESAMVYEINTSSAALRALLMQPQFNDTMVELVAVVEAHDHLLNLVAVGNVSLSEMKKAVRAMDKALANLYAKDQAGTYKGADGQEKTYKEHTLADQAFDIVCKHGYYLEFTPGFKGATFSRSEKKVTYIGLKRMLGQ